MTVETSTRNATLQDLAALLRDQHARKRDVVAPASTLYFRDGVLRIRGTEAVIDEAGVTRVDGAYRPINKDAVREVHLSGRMDDGVIRWSEDTQSKRARPLIPRREDISRSCTQSSRDYATAWRTRCLLRGARSGGACGAGGSQQCLATGTRAAPELSLPAPRPGRHATTAGPS